MTTNPISTTSPDQLQSKKGLSSLKASDFINLMVTELKNQDPTQPTSNEALLSQMSQIGQLESSASLQSTLTSLTTQNQIGAASSLIGKTVQGNDSNNKSISGVVTSVKVANASGAVSLELDTGSSLDLGSVTNIAPATNATKAAA